MVTQQELLRQTQLGAVRTAELQRQQALAIEKAREQQLAQQAAQVTQVAPDKVAPMEQLPVQLAIEQLQSGNFSYEGHHLDQLSKQQRNIYKDILDEAASAGVHKGEFVSRLADMISTQPGYGVPTAEYAGVSTPEGVIFERIPTAPTVEFKPKIAEFAPPTFAGITLPIREAEPPPSVVLPAPTFLEKVEMGLGRARIETRKAYGRLFEKEPSLEPIIPRSRREIIPKVREAGAEILTGLVIRAPRRAGELPGVVYEKLAPKAGITVPTPETIIPQRITIGAGVGEVRFPAGDVRILTPSDVRVGGGVAGELAPWAYFGPAKLAAIGAPIFLAPPEAQVTEEERITGALMVMPFLGKQVGKAVKIPYKFFKQPIGERITLTPAKKLIPKELAAISAPKGRTIVTMPSGEQVIRESVDVIGKGGFIQEGGKTVITTKFRKTFGLKPFYEGIPYGKVGSKQYKKALKSIMKKGGLTESEAKAILRYRKPKLVIKELKGLKKPFGEVEILYREGKEPAITFIGKEITQPIQIKVDGKALTAGGRGEVRYLGADIAEPELIKEVERVTADITAKKAFLTKEGAPFSPLRLKGKTTEQIKQITLLKKTGERELPARDPFYGEAIEYYKDLPASRRLLPLRRKAELGRIGEVRIGKGEPLITLEADAPIRISKLPKIDPFVPKKPVEVIITKEKGKQIIKTLEQVYGKPTKEQVELARKQLLGVIPRAKPPKVVPKIVSVKIAPELEVPTIAPTARIIPKERVVLVPEKAEVRIEEPLGGSMFADLTGVGRIEDLKDEGRIRDLGVLGGRFSLGDLDLDKTITKQVPKYITITKAKPTTALREDLVTKQVIRQAVRLKAVPRLKVTPRVIARMKAPIFRPTRPPKPPGVPAPVTFPGEEGRFPYGRRKKKEEELFLPFVRRYGKFIPVGKPVRLERAKRKGIRALRRTLGATLQIRKKTGEIVPFVKEGREFRLGKKGLVQRAPFRLGTVQERLEIIRARKGGIKFI